MPKKDKQSQPNEKEKKPRLQKLAWFFHRLFKRKRESVPTPTHFTWFERFLDDLDKDSDIYDRAEMAVGLCDEALETMSVRLRLIGQLRDVSDRLLGGECFAHLSEADAVRFSELTAQYNEAYQDRSAFKHRVAGFDNAIDAVGRREDEARAAVAEIRDAEEKQRIFRQDLNYLQGEKAELEYERETLIYTIGFLEKFSIGVIVVLSAAAIALGFVFIFLQVQTFVPIVILVALIAAAIWSARMMGRRFRRDLEWNRAKQVRAVEIINKKTIVYSHYTNFLQYEYKKFKIRNAEMLRVHLRDYNTYRQLSQRYDESSDIMRLTNEELEHFLRTRRIPMSAELAPFAALPNHAERESLRLRLDAERTEIESELAALDNQIAGIWEKLSALREADTEPGGAVEDVIAAYLNKAGRMMESNGRI